MRIRLAATVPLITVLVTVVTASAAASTTVSAAPPSPGDAQAHTRSVCAQAVPGSARCFAQIRTDTGTTLVDGSRPATALPSGYSPADLRAAYQLPANGAKRQTIAIVDAGDNADAEADLAVYRQTYGLPACTTANGCFRKVNQRGTSTPLPQDQGWGPEISLDLDMASAACPTCEILLVEGDDATFDALAHAENTAVALGASVVSNSYGGPEFNGDSTYAAAYRHPGVAIIVSSGDSGYGIPSFPATLASVVAVGGTTLNRAATTRGFVETTWSGSASGCSAYQPKPVWQKDRHCPGRMTVDVSAVADPATGPAVYDAHDGIGWTIIGGTSASAPYIAGVIGLTGHHAAFADASTLYRHASALNDVTAGTNTGAMDCGRDYQCNATPGYDGPTGLGTPHGTTAF